MGTQTIDFGASVVVILLRRDSDSLAPEEISAIRAKFPGRTVMFRRTDPQDYQEHAIDCQRLNPGAVILPRERPIPSLAMELGYAHVAFVDGEYRELLPLVPQFKGFVPRRVSYLM